MTFLLQQLSYMTFLLPPDPGELRVVPIVLPSLSGHCEILDTDMNLRSKEYAACLLRRSYRFYLTVAGQLDTGSTAWVLKRRRGENSRGFYVLPGNNDSWEKLH